jgi:transposase InsO family protein
MSAGRIFGSASSDRFWLRLPPEASSKGNSGNWPPKSGATPFPENGFYSGFPRSSAGITKPSTPRPGRSKRSNAKSAPTTGNTLNFHLLYVFIVLSHHRRRILHFNVAAAPSAAWTVQQLREAFPFISPPRYLLRDRDSIYGLLFQRRAEALGLEEVRIAPRSPWQSPYVERLIGSIRRECLDHVIVLNEAHLHRLLKAYLAYYHRSRIHLGLNKDAPEPRPVQGPEDGKIVSLPQVGGLHHRYERLAA